MKSQGITEADSLGNEQSGKLREEKDEEEETATERRREYTNLRLNLQEKRASRLPCFSFGRGEVCGSSDDRRGMSGNQRCEPANLPHLYERQALTASSTSTDH